MNNSAPSLSDITDAFRQAMAEAGIVTEAPLIADGVLHRVHIEGQRRGSLNGAYVLHADGIPRGWFQNFVSGFSTTWSMDGVRRNLSKEAHRQIHEERIKREAERAAKQLEQAEKARQLWDSALPCSGEHPYLKRKQVGAHGVRLAAGPWAKWVQDDTGRWQRFAIPGALLVPLRDEAGVLWNLQVIFPEKVAVLGDRDKDFAPGRKSGLFHTIGDPTPTILVAEGYATAATLHEQTGHQVIVAFDCHNLLPVAIATRRAHPKADLVIAADNDHATPGNPGLTKARAVAVAVNAKLWVPPFKAGDAGTDWNDWALLKGGRHHG